MHYTGNENDWPTVAIEGDGKKVVGWDTFHKWLTRAYRIGRKTFHLAADEVSSPPIHFHDRKQELLRARRREETRQLIIQQLQEVENDKQVNVQTSVMHTLRLQSLMLNTNNVFYFKEGRRIVRIRPTYPMLRLVK